MENLFKKISHRIDGLIWSLFSSGILFLLMAAVAIYTDLVIRLVFSLASLIISYIFIFSALKLWHLKKDIKNHFSVKKY